MMVRPTILLLVLGSILGIGVSLSAKRLADARARLDGAQSSLAQTRGDINRVLELRAKRQTIAEQKRPDQDIIARVNAVLAEVGIPSDRFDGLRPESDAALPRSGDSQSSYRRQSVRVTLNDLSVTQVGEFLSRWSASQPLWIPTRIELTHARSNSAEGRYTLNILLSAMYVAHEVPA